MGNNPFFFATRLVQHMSEQLAFIYVIQATIYHFDEYKNNNTAAMVTEFYAMRNYVRQFE